MPRLVRRFDGPDLQDLLAQVRDELGDDAMITAAHKVRRGGVGGFFARERFEVEVEVDDDGRVAADAAASTVSPSASASPAHDDEPFVPASPRSLLDLADKVSAAERVAAGQEPDDPFADHGAFGEVLRQMLAERRAATAADSPDSPVTKRSTVRPDNVEPVTAVATTTVTTVDRTRSTYAAVAPAAPVIAAGATVAPVTAPPTPASSVAPAVVTGRDLEPAEPIASVLLRCGLPAAYVPVGPLATGLFETLRERLQELPPPPALPRRAGSVVAVVGFRDDALGLARELAEEMRVGEDDIVLASSGYRGRQIPQWRRVDSAASAAEERRSWRRRSRPTIVAVDAPPGLYGGTWARQVLDAIEPSVSWAVVEATRKTEDVAAWVSAMGGVDVLSVQDASETITPASILHLGIPVGRLDGEPADATKWAQLLVDAAAVVFPNDALASRN